MATCRCGQDYSTDLPWSDPTHDVLKCGAWVRADAESAYDGLTYVYDTTPDDVRMAQQREALKEGTPVYDATGRLVGHLGKVIWHAHDGDDCVSFTINPG